MATPLATRAAGLPTLQEVAVSASSQQMTGIADSASEGTVAAKQLAARPLLRPAEAMEAVPGMIVTQHSGDGKANQYFLRGFNLDHGSDFASYVDGMRVNNVSHAHGQGYMDLNFLIPELIGRLRYRKGVYAAEDGDFAVTGSVRIDYARTLAAPFVDLTVGGHDYRRLLAAGSRALTDDINALAAIEYVGNNGPWEVPEQFGKRNAVLKLSRGTAQNGQALSLMAYDAQWTATEHVPERAIDNGEIGRYGTLAPRDGGRTHRYSLSYDWAESDSNQLRRANAYVIDYGLKLFSSPSGLLDGQHEQSDQRTAWGGNASQTWLLGERWFDSEATLGVQFRQDRIDLGLYQTTARQRNTATRVDRVTENALGIYGELRSQWQPWLRSTLGLRWDGMRASVTPVAGTFNMNNGGAVSASQLSPKVGVVFGPFSNAPSTEYYLNWGRGFHSNDARGGSTTTNVVNGSRVDTTPLMVMATGSEIGVRTSPLPGWQSSLTLWQIALSSELIFVGDEGVTEPRGGSHRHGIEWSNYYTNGNGLIIDGDIAVSRAKLDEASSGGTHVPNAVPLTASLAATLDEGGAWFGGARLRYLGAYPLEETNTEKSTAFWTLNLKLGYRLSKQLQFSADILNLFDRKANDIEYWGSSCTRSEGAGCNAGAGFDGRSIHPLEPRTLRVGMRISF
jgi:hypothetical protein